MRELEEADAWIEAAKYTLEDNSKGRARFTVVVAQAIHALIRANDALALTFLKKRSTRHEDAAVLFGDLIRQGKVDPKYAPLRTLLTRAIAEKSEYDYKGREVGREAASRRLRDVERFLGATKEILNRST